MLLLLLGVDGAQFRTPSNKDEVLEKLIIDIAGGSKNALEELYGRRIVRYMGSPSLSLRGPMKLKMLCMMPM